MVQYQAACFVQTAVHMRALKAPCVMGMTVSFCCLPVACCVSAEGGPGVNRPQRAGQLDVCAALPQQLCKGYTLVRWGAKQSKVELSTSGPVDGTRLLDLTALSQISVCGRWSRTYLL